MKKNLFKLAAFAAVALVAVSCDKSDNNGGDSSDEFIAVTANDLDVEFGATVSSDAPSWASTTANWSKTDSGFYADEAAATTAFNSATTIAASGSQSISGVCKFSGVVKVANGETLTIAAGTVIIADGSDDIKDYIIIEQGGKIQATGSASEPIIMTTTDMKRGGWGGIHICGKASINVTGGTGTSEIGDATYGGTSDSDSSGTLSYVRIEYSGYALDADHEANGFSFYGVGSGTTVEYCHSYQGLDDGFEWFGGTVGGKYLISSNSGDDSFDWTYGFRGELDYIYAVQLDDDCDKLIEGDNNGSNYTATPYSHPVISNGTFVGCQSSIAGSNSIGLRIRCGSQLTMSDSTIAGYDYSFDLSSRETSEYFRTTSSALSNIKASGALKVSEVDE